MEAALAGSSLLIGGLASYALTPLAGRIAIRLGILDIPEPTLATQKKHSRPTPYLGGLAIIFGLLAPAMLLPFADFLGEAPIRDYAMIAMVAIALGVVGLLDDLLRLPRLVRLSAQVSAAIAVWLLDFRVQATGDVRIDLVLTLVWIVGITNAFNLLDNMDGLSAGLATVACVAFTALAILNDLTVLPVMAAGLGGACAGFLIHNKPPAKIFMGDAGSLFIGFLIALFGLRLRFDNLVQVTFLIPVVVLGVPILDTTLVVVSRLKNRRPVFLGARDHISHRLVGLGLSTRTAVGLLYLVSLCLGWLGIVISRANPEVGFMLLGLVLALGAIFAIVLLRVPVYEHLLEKDDEVDLGPEPS